MAPRVNSDHLSGSFENKIRTKRPACVHVNAAWEALTRRMRLRPLPAGEVTPSEKKPVVSFEAHVMRQNSTASAQLFCGSRIFPRFTHLSQVHASFPGSRILPSSRLFPSIGPFSLEGEGQDEGPHAGAVQVHPLHISPGTSFTPVRSRLVNQGGSLCRGTRPIRWINAVSS